MQDEKLYKFDENAQPALIGTSAESGTKPEPMDAAQPDAACSPNPIVKIAVTGGPCGGKTTLMARAMQELGQRGLKVLVVPEAPTELITAMNIVPGPDISMEAFQGYLMELQYAHERVVDEAAKAFAKNSPVVILCDRGKMDPLAYVGDDVLRPLLAIHAESLLSARDSYDAVIVMTTAADGAEEAYTLSNNAARSETPEQARELDRASTAAWTGHPHLHIIDNSTNFEQKMHRALSAVFESVGIPIPVERERKFLVRMPDMSALAQYGPVRSTILQTYLPSEAGSERRVRQRGDGTEFTYFYTEKIPVPGRPAERLEREKVVSQQEYLALLAQADYADTVPVRKDRYCFPYKGHYLELDIYATEKEFAVLEVEYLEGGQDIQIPPEIEVISEVTGQAEYSNYSIAHNGGRLPHPEV